MWAIADFPVVVFKIGSNEAKADREWLKKRKDYFEKLWSTNGKVILRKLEDACGERFTNTAIQEGISVILHKKASKDRSGSLKEDNPLEISLFLTKNDTNASAKELLVRMLAHSFIHQQYEFHFRIREQTLFEDVLADELVTSMVSYMVLGKKPGRTNCEKALTEAIDETVHRLSQKAARNKLIDMLCNFTQETGKTKKQKTDILTKRETLIQQLLTLLPKTGD